jgi:hypothetical protein
MMDFCLLFGQWASCSWGVNILATSSPYSSLSVVIRAMRGQLGNWGAMGFLTQVLVMLAHRRVRVICGKMERLCQRFQAGKLWRMPAHVSASRRGEAGVLRAKPGLTLPHRFGWLVRAVGWRAAGYGGQLQAALQTPEMIELLLVAPQAARILRPLCRMLAVDLRCLQPGVAVVFEPPAAVGTVKKRERQPRVSMQIGRIPWPRGVISWARREGFGKVPRE